ncbi:MAG: ABC transporter substrate binding protein [Gammaproteobacteria bacterium]|nr:ABC transporter substrate binding protein [Gammaproteobacteria bacterium]
MLLILILFILFCQPAYAIEQVHILYHDSNTSSRLFKEQLTRTFLANDIKHQTVNLDRVKNIRTLSSAGELVFITVGSRALQTAWQQLKNKKIFSLLVSQDKIKNIIATSSHDNELYGLYLEQPLKRQIFLAQQLIPGIRTIGFLTTPDNYTSLRNQLKYYQSNADFQIQTVNDQRSLGRALSYILKNSELLITLAEPEIYNRSSLRNILLSSYRNNVPLLGLNKAFVDAGCLAAVYTTNEQFAQEAAEILNSTTDRMLLPKIHYAKKFAISLNHKVARFLGLYIHTKKEILTRMTENE